jgi:hypothetical protein
MKQTITYENYADGYFQLFRSGAEIIEIDGKQTIKSICPYGRLTNQSFNVWNKYSKSKGLYIRPHLSGEYVFENRLNGWKYMLKVIMGFDDEQTNNILNTYNKVVASSMPLKCVFTDLGEIVLYNPEKTKDPKPITKICKTQNKFFKEWGEPLIYNSLKEKYPDGIVVRGWKFEKGSEYIICDTFHGPLEDYRNYLIPELYKGKLLEKINNKYNDKILSGEYFKEVCEELYNLGSIDLSSSWDYTEEEKEQIRIQVENEIRKKQEEQEKLERRKHTPGYCSICGAENAKYIPFIEEYRCECCFNDMFY